jgi:oligoendopeptidase F
MKGLLRLFIIYSIFQLVFFSVKSQEPSFNPFPKKNEGSYHLDFTRYFTNKFEETKDLDVFYKKLDRFFSFKNESTLSAKNLLTSLQLYDSLLIQYKKHYIYNNLLSSVNTNNYASSDLIDKIDAIFSAKTTFFEKEISNLTPAKIVNFTAEEPDLKKYSYYIDDIFRNKQHLPNSSIEEKINSLYPAISGWQFDLYSSITRNIRFDDIESSKGLLNVKRDRAIINANSDSLVRKVGFKKLYIGFNSMRNLYAFTLIKLVKGVNEEALLHNFKEADDYFYFDKFQTKESINSILKQIADSVAIYKRFQQITSECKKKKMQSNKIHYWDLAFTTGFIQPRHTIDSASQIILSALLPLGDDYQKELTNLLNPINGRMEIAPSENKRSGGFSSGFIGINSVFFTEGYNGFYNDMRVLTHESTHAIHRQLMNTNNVLPIYASGPNYLFESFAIFSEFLLTDYLVENSKSKEEKQYYLEEYFNNKGMALFSIASDALLEQKIHEGVINGTINSADDLDSLNETINKTFSIWNTKEYPELNQRWITAGLFYEDPFYEINYVLGAMLALKYYQIYSVDKDLFTKNYISLLKNGFNAPPEKLLKTFLNIDMNDPNLVGDAMRVTKIKVNQIEELYK